MHGLLHESIKRAEEQLIHLKAMDEKLVCQDKISGMILSTVKSGMTYLSGNLTSSADFKH